MQDAADPSFPVNPADIQGDNIGEGDDDPKEIQVPSLSDIFFNGGRGSLDLKMSKSEHNPRKFSRRIAQTPDKKTPHRTSAASMHKVNLTSSKSGGIPGTSEHGSLRSYRRSNSFSKRRANHLDKRKSGNELDTLRASEGASGIDGNSEELKVSGNPTVSTSISRRRSGMPVSSVHRRARPSRGDVEARHSSQQDYPKRRHSADKFEDDTESPGKGRAESDSNEFTVPALKADSLASADHFLTDGQDDENTHNTATTNLADQDIPAGKPRSQSFEHRASPRKQMSRADSNSSGDNGVARPHRASHSSERRRHRRTVDARPLSNSLTNSNETTTSPTTPTSEQDLSKRTRTTRHGTSQSSWTRNLRRMKKTSEEDNDVRPSTSSSTPKEDGSSHSSKLGSDSKKSSSLQEEGTNSQRQRRREADDHPRDAKACEDDKESHHSHQDQNPISSSGRSSVPSSPGKELTPRRQKSKSLNRPSGANVPVDDTRSPPLSQFLDSLLVGNKEKVIVEETILSNESTATQELTTPAPLDLFAGEGHKNMVEPTLPPSFDMPSDHLPTNLSPKTEKTTVLVGGYDQQKNDTYLDNRHVTSNKNESPLTRHDRLTTETVTHNQGFVDAKSPTKDFFEDFSAREAPTTVNNNDARVFSLRSPTEKVSSTANQGNKPTQFLTRNSMLPKGPFFSPTGRASSMFFDKEAMDQGMRKLANLNLSVTSHGRKKKGLNNFLTTTMKFNKLADGGDSVCLEDLPFAKDSTETARQESAKPSNAPLDKMFMKSNQDYDDTLNDSGGLSFSMDLAVPEPKAQNKLFSLASQPSRRGLFAKKPKKFQTFDDSDIVSFSMDDKHLPKQSLQEVNNGKSLDPPKRERSNSYDNPLDRNIFGVGFALDDHITSSALETPSQDQTATFDGRKSHGLRGASSDDFAWELPTSRVNVFQNQSTRSKSSDLLDCGEDRGSKLENLLEQPGHRKVSQLAEPSICGTLADAGKTHGKDALSSTPTGVLDHADEVKGGRLLVQDDEIVSTASSGSDEDVANPLPDAHRGIQLKDVLNDANFLAPSDASVCDQSVMTLEQQQHFLQLNLPGMVGYKSSSSKSVLEHAVEVLGDASRGKGSY